MKEVKTRAFFEDNLVFKKRDLSTLQTPPFSMKAAYAADNWSVVVPDEEAVNFYALNQMVAIIKMAFSKNEKLPPLESQVYETYLDTVLSQFGRTLYYLAFISVRESRHLKNKSVFLSSYFSYLKSEEFHSALKKWFGTVPDGASDAVSKFKNSPPDAPLGEVLLLLEDAFNKGSWSSGYGGPPWGNIVRCIRSFISGETTPEVMIDTSYTLAHNGGPMYNKGMLYSLHTNYLLPILDVQRGGMMCEALLEGSEIVKKLNCSKILDFCTKMKDKYPNKIEDKVDWEKVVELGAVSSYAKSKAKTLPTPKKVEKVEPVEIIITSWASFKTTGKYYKIFTPNVSNFKILERV